MYKNLRWLHKVCGVVGALSLILIGFTGFFLALKDQFPSIKPPSEKSKVEIDLHKFVSPAVAIDVAIASNHPNIKSDKDLDRVEIHASKGIYKLISKEGFAELQVDAMTGELLKTGVRNDQLLENIHDLRFFHPSLRTYLLPVIAVILVTLGITGLCIYITPIMRRRKFKAQTRESR